jgi:radical SAM superfamily enzyme YgiQ (UPF0313 family)
MTSKISTLLIHPRHVDWARKLPLGLAYLASYLRLKGHPVAVLDVCVDRISDDAIADRIRECDVGLIGITATTPQIHNAWELASVIKKKNPLAKIVLGGAHVSALPEESLAIEAVDFVVLGEGEETLFELLETLERDEDLSRVKGLGYKKDNQILITQPRPFVQNLDELPFPARDLFAFPGAYRSPGQLYPFFADILTSRGCPSHCTFCANKATLGGSFRARSPGNVVGEIADLHDRYGIKEFHISDDTFTYDHDRALAICKEICNLGYAIKWACGNGVRVDSLTDSLVGWMKKSGCYRVGIGIESCDEDVLRRLGKGTTLEEVRGAIALLRKHRIITVGFFMFGNLTETNETMRRTIRMSSRLNLDYAQYTILTPFPGTLAFKYFERNGYLQSTDWRSYGLFNEPVFSTPTVNKDSLTKMYAQAYRAFYFRPSYIIRKVKRLLTNRYELKLAFLGFKEILKRSTRPRFH